MAMTVTMVMRLAILAIVVTYKQLKLKLSVATYHPQSIMRKQICCKKVKGTEAKVPGGLRQWQAGKDIWQQWQQYLTTMATMATMPMCGRIPAVIVLVAKSWLSIMIIIITL